MSSETTAPRVGYYAALEDAATTYPLVTEALMRSDRHRMRRWQQFIDPLDIQAMETLHEFLASASASLASARATIGAGSLPERIADDVRACLEAIVGGYLNVAAGAMRDVMEAELLVRDFALDPQRIERWVSADEKSLRRQFQPAACRRRQADALGVAPDDLEGALDYKAHSQVLHVTPLRLFSGAPEAAGQEATAVLDQVAEIHFHGTRAVQALNQLLAAVGQSPLYSEPVIAALAEASTDLAKARAVLDAVANRVAEACEPRARSVVILESGLVLAAHDADRQVDSYSLNRTDFRHFGRSVAEGHPAEFELTPLDPSSH